MQHDQNLNSQKGNQDSGPAKGQPKTNNKKKNSKKDRKNTDKPKKVLNYHQPNFRFQQNVVQRLIFKQLKVQFLEDLATFVSVPRGRIIHEVMKDFFKKQANLEDAAKCCHFILEGLTITCPQPKVPRKLIFTFLKIMIGQKSKISKLLNKKAGDKLLDKIPLEYLVDIVELFDLKLSRKDASIFFKQLAESANFTAVPRFMNLTEYDFEQELVPVIQRLIAEKQYKTLRTIPNLKKMFKQNKVLIKEKANMLKGAANYQFKSEGWEYLEEIFQYHPNVIANVLNGNFGQRSSKFQNDDKYLEGVVSICQRIPQVLERLKPDTKDVIKKKREKMIKQGRPFPLNFLRVDTFQPSSKDYFSFEQFQLTEGHIIWVDDKLDNEKLKQIKLQLLKEERIAIDTESTLVRTPIDMDLDVLSLIQVSTSKQVYLIDPYRSKHPQIKDFFKQFFSDKSKLIIGHTIEGDLEGIANFFGLGRPVCKILDIKEEYKDFMEVNKQFGLKNVSKEILGKEICKQYTMTNWDRRPLNKCQIHYAAMDAFVIFKIWDKLSELIQDKKKNPQKYKKPETDIGAKEPVDNQEETAEQQIIKDEESEA